MESLIKKQVMVIGKIKELLVFILILTMLLITSAYVQQLIVVTTENFTPYNYIESDTVKGVLTVIIRATLAKPELKQKSMPTHAQERTR